MQAIRANVQPALQGSPRFRRAGVAQILVVAQLAASVVVLVGAGSYVRTLDPAVPVLSLLTIEQQIDDQLKQELLFARLSTAFGLLALVLASVGLSSVRSYSVSRWTSEIGVRMALGATRGEIVALVMRETAALTAVGIALGLAVGYGVTGLIRSMLFGLEPHDPATFAGAALVLAAVAAAAGYLPARRASRVDPMEALRQD